MQRVPYHSMEAPVSTSHPDGPATGSAAYVPARGVFDAMPRPVSPGGEPTDRIFAEPVSRASDFAFNTATVRVFDDMVSRSVPFYGEIQRMTTELAVAFAQPGSALYDIGCSTGTTLAALEPWVDPSVHFVGYDNAPEMVERARGRLAEVPTARRRDVREVDVHEPFIVEDASVTVMLFTLQFVRPLHRERVIRTIADGTRADGVLILVEKVIESDTLFNRLFIEHYYAMKRRHGYTEMEVAQKREALENVLIPYRMDENAELLRRCGFGRVQEFFRWYNFAGVIAVK
jgi:tRNA (cmo5U34)-methyltransferase